MGNYDFSFNKKVDVRTFRSVTVNYEADSMTNGDTPPLPQQEAQASVIFFLGMSAGGGKNKHFWLNKNIEQKYLFFTFLYYFNPKMV